MLLPSLKHQRMIFPKKSSPIVSTHAPHKTAITIKHLCAHTIDDLYPYNVTNFLKSNELKKVELRFKSFPFLLVS